MTNASVLSQLEQIQLRLGIRRSIRVLESRDEWMPVTWGIVRPVILLPSRVLAWNIESPGQLDAVLAHEAAHIARWDALSQWIARLATTLYWFNPLVWIAARVARLEREQACDDVVLTLGQKPSEYAGHLLTVAQSLRPAVVGGLAMARLAQIEHRIRAILDERHDRRGPSHASLALTSALVAFMLPVSAVCLTADTRPTVAAIPPGSYAPAPAAPVPAQSSGSPVLRRTTVHAQTTSAQAPPQQRSADSAAILSWRAERMAMIQQLADRALLEVEEMRKKVNIGTVAPFEEERAKRTVDQIVAVLQAERERALPRSAPSDAEKASVRERFAQAMRNLDYVERRFTVGLANGAEIETALVAAADVVRGSSASPSTGADPIMTDAALIAALRATATFFSDRERANALLSLAQGYALTPEMVSLYVTAASGITSDAERARVFAQPIRVKPPGR